MKYKRIYQKFNKSTLLLGPRGTGKSTYIESEIKPDLILNLLKSSTFKILLKDPSELENMIQHLKSGSIVFIDEVQKIPELLDEVHRLIESKKIHFVLTGSSARKLKKSGVNLMAGRAINKKFYPLTLKEIGSEKSIESIIFSGLLPSAVNLKSKDDVNDYLFSYVDLYLKEEIFQEGLSRNLSQFSEFIEIAGQYNGQIINYENIAKSIGVSGDTIKSWFKVLQDTLLGDYTEAYHLNLMKKETRHPKFYFFDHGISRAAEGLRTLESVSEKNGFYLENIILNELKVYREVNKKDFKIFFYNVPGIGDIDFVIETRRKTLSKPAEFILLNVKYSKNWNTQFNKLSNLILEKFEKNCLRSIGIYRGDQRLTYEKNEIYPINDFVKLIWSGKLF